MEKQYLLAGGWLAVSFLISLLATAAGVAWALRPLRSAGDRPWYEQARLAYPAMVVAVVAFSPLMLLGLAFGFLFGAGAEVEFVLIPVAGAVGAILGTMPICYRLRRRLIGPRITLRNWLCDMVVRAALFMGGILVAAGVLFASPGLFGVRSAVVLVVGIGLIVALAFGGSLWLLRAAGIARPASERLQTIATQTAAAAGIPLRGVYELRWQMANAVAFPLSGAIAFSDAAMDSFNDEQIATICAHELAHLVEPFRIRAARMANAMLMLAYVECLILARTFGIRFVAYGVAGLLLAKIVITRRSRAWEASADSAATASAASGPVYGGALLRLYEVNFLPLVGSFRGGTHPHAYDRISATGLQLDFPRPPAPSLARSIVGIVIMLLIAVPLNFVAIVAELIIHAVIHRAG